MKKVGFFRSIKFQIPVLLCVVLLIPLLLLYQANASLINRITLQDTKDSVSGDLAGKALSIDYVLNEVTQFAKLQGSDTELLELIRAYVDAQGREKQVARSRLTLALGQSIIYRDVIDEVYLILEDSNTIVSTIVGAKELGAASPRNAALFADYAEHKNMLTWSANVPINGESSMLYYRPIAGYGLPECSLVFEVNTDYLLKMMESKALDHAGIIVCDYLGNIMLEEGMAQIDPALTDTPSIREHDLLSPVIRERNKAGSYVSKHNGEELLVGYYSSTGTSWKYMEIVRTQDIYATAGASTAYLIFSVMIGILSALLGVVAISKLILQPMDRILTAMKRTETGAFETVGGVLPRNELGVLTAGYNHMTAHLQELIDNVYMQELSKREAQLISIQSQLDEHFLYNTLNTIYCVTKRGDTELSAEMLVMLTRFFRMNLSEGRQFLKISEIVELIQCYLWIQKARYGERLKIHIEADPSIAECYAVKYLFQPIVENAVTHGLESKVGGGEVTIRFRAAEGMLEFETADNGIGMSPQQLSRLKQTICDCRRVVGESFALKNINEQIRLVYGQENALHIESEEGVGTRVGFRIPLKKEDPNET